MDEIQELAEIFKALSDPTRGGSGVVPLCTTRLTKTGWKSKVALRETLGEDLAVG